MIEYCFTHCFPFVGYLTLVHPVILRLYEDQRFPKRGHFSVGVALECKH
jgi:hypothetical protein